MKKSYLIWMILIGNSLSSLQLNAQAGSGRIIIKLVGNTTMQTVPTIASIAGIQIVTALPDSNTIGYLSQPDNNATTRLVPAGNVSSWLQSYVNQQYGSTFSVNGKKLVWFIPKLSISRNRPATYVFTKTKAGLYESTGAQLKPLSLCDTLLATIAVAGDTNVYGNAIAAAIQVLYIRSITALNGTVFPGTPSGNTTIASLLAAVTQERNLPILRDSIYRQGVYRSFDEFKANNPSVSNGVAVVDTNDSTRIKLAQHIDSVLQDVPNAWGVCINRELYILKAGKLIPVEVANSSMVISRFQEPPVRKNQAIYWRRNLSSRTGDINPFSREHYYLAAGLPALPLVAPPEATGVEMETGAASF